MQVINKEKAGKRLCPFKVSGDFCVADKCMSWRFGESRKFGRTKEDAKALKEEGWSIVGIEVELGIESLTLRKVLDVGYCGVAGLPGQLPTENG